MKAVYMINGFLESGKSEFIRYTIAQRYFAIKGKTLLICCEEGEIEYDLEALKKSNTVLVNIEEEEDFNVDYLMALDKTHNPERIIIEWNGMWKFKDLKLPLHWSIEQQITEIDTRTFEIYYANMRSQLSEMFRNSGLVIFNRCEEQGDKLTNFKRNVRALNQNCQIVFEDKNGEVDVFIAEDLPYDINADEIELTDDTYGIWFLDCIEGIERNLGKTLTFYGVVAALEPIENVFLPGRMAMTCCADDLELLAFPCIYDKVNTLVEGEWVKVVATLEFRKNSIYKGEEGPVLVAKRVVKASEPKKAVIDFNS